MAGREYPETPIVGVGAVVVDKDRVLLVRRGQEPLKGEWSIPGGVLELGESLETGIRREVLEETGLEVRIAGVVEVLDRIVLEDGCVRYHYVLIDYLAFPIGGVVKAASDAADARWVAHKQLNSHGMYRLALSTAAVIEKAFAMAKATENANPA